jgi:hypothetical protein
LQVTPFTQVEDVIGEAEHDTIAAGDLPGPLDGMRKVDVLQARCLLDVPQLP